MTLNSISKADQSMMLNQQSVIDASLAQADELPAGGAAADSDAVDMAVLVAFEELQEDGEPDLILELIGLYLQGAPVLITAIRNAVADADGLSLKRAAHSLKGSSGTLGVQQLAAICEQLERLAEDAFSREAEALLNRLEQEFGRAHKVLVSEQTRRLLAQQS